MSVNLPFPFQDFLRRWSAHRLVRFIYFRQQLQVGPREASLKPMAAVAGFLHLAVFQVPAYQPRHLRPASSGHLRHVTPQQPAHHLALRPVALLSQKSRDPVIHFLPPFAFKADFLAGFQKRPDLLQAQFLSILHADDQSLACAPLPSGSFCVGNGPAFRLILH